MIIEITFSIITILVITMKEGRVWGVFLFYFCIFLKSSIESGKIECQIGNVMFLVEIKCTKSAQGCAMFADIVYSLCSFIIEGSRRKGF